ncbi:PKD-like domain-containing protein [Gaoshiqia sp. Z1-71]|uniref:PKD-like domain-containing protein n=1 Tax=Gaoshiqia hydrogeniformans TaxID=3290090 RepID=UPI003BF822C9
MTRTSQFAGTSFLLLLLLSSINPLHAFHFGLEASKVEAAKRNRPLLYPHQAGTMAVGYTVTAERRPGAGDGSIDLRISNATNLQSITWSKGETTEDLCGVTAGTYQVGITDDTGTKPSSSKGNLVYELIEIVDGNNCVPPVSGSGSIQVITQATVDHPGDLSFCQGELTNPIPLTGSPSNVVFDISGGVSIGLNNRSGVTAILPFKALAGSVNLTITPCANGCSGDPISVPVTVHPKADISVSRVLQTICSGSTGAIGLSSSSADAGFSWGVKSISPSGSISGASDGSGSVLAQTLVNTTSAQASVIYMVSSAICGCAGSTLDVTFQVEPEIQAEISGGTTICQGDADAVITFTAANGTAPYTFSYHINGGTTKTITSPTGTAQITLAGGTPGTYTYELSAVQDQTGCNYAANGTTTVTINPKPELTSDLTPSGICSNDLFSYTPAFSVPGTAYTWTRKAIPGISDPERTETSPINEYINNTTKDPIAVTYAFTMTTPAGCTNNEDVVVMVTQVPRLTSPLTPDAICSGTLFSYEPRSDVSETEFTWTRAAVTGISNSAAGGTGNPNEVLVNTTSEPIGVTYLYALNANGCESLVIYPVYVVVVPSPQVSALASKTGICPGESVNLYSSSNVSSALPATLFAENFDSGSPNNRNGFNGWDTWYNNSNAAWTLRDDNYTYSSGWNSVIFRSNDRSKFFLANSNAAGNTSITSILTSPAINTFGYTSLELNFWYYYESGGSSDHPKIQVSTNGSNWMDIDELTSTKGTGTGFVNYSTSLNGYVGQSSLYIRFSYEARDDYYWAIDNVSVTGAGTTAEMYWTSNPAGFSSTEQNPTNVTPGQTTDYIAWYVNPYTGCSGSDTVTVIVLEPPVPIITADYCTYVPKILLSAPPGYSNYLWSTGETTQSILVDLAAIYTVTVDDGNGCTGSASFNTSTELVVNGNFDDGNTGFTTGYHYVADNPASTSELYPEGYYSVGTNGHDFHSNFWGYDHTTGSGNYMIVNGWGSSLVVWEETITIQPNTLYYFSAWAKSMNDYGPFAKLRFEINSTQVGTTANLTAGINNNSNPWTERFYGNWNSGTATTATVRIINLETALGGNDFGLDDISFGTLASRSAEVSPDVNGYICEGESIYLEANVQYGREPITFLWTGPNGWSSTTENPVINNATTAAAGTYTVQVWDTYGCENQSQSVSVNVYPKANVNAGPDQQVCFENPLVTLAGTISGGVTTGTWSGGAGNFNPNNRSLNATYIPTQAEINAGTIELTLTSDTPAGPCPAQSSSTTITIYPEIELNFNPVQPICHGGTDGSITVSAGNGLAPYTYLWSDGQKTANAVGLSTGTYSVTVTDKQGCSVTESVFLPEPSQFAVKTPSYVEPTCYGEDNGSATITASGGTPPYEFIWDTAAGSQTSATATGLSAGTYSVIVLSDSHACTATAVSVTIPEPEAPDLSCPDDIAVMVDPGKAYASNVTVSAADYDNFCESIEYVMTGATTGSAQGLVPSPSTFNLGVTTIEYTSVNLKGEDLHCSFTVTVKPETPEITCSDPISVSTDAGVCTATVEVSLPAIDNGEGISWTWTMSGANTGSGTGPIPSPYTFNKSVTTIAWVAVNSAGTAGCLQTVTVNDTEAPEFIEPFDIEVCVERIKEFTYTSQTVPDYYTFEPGNKMLDLNTASFTDNCGLVCGAQIEWRVVFSDGSTLPESGYISGQPSMYTPGFRFPGDGDSFQPLVHKIYYRITDCSGKQSEELVTNVTVHPRPEIVRNF